MASAVDMLYGERMLFSAALTPTWRKISRAKRLLARTSADRGGDVSSAWRVADGISASGRHKAGNLKDNFIRSIRRKIAKDLPRILLILSLASHRGRNSTVIASFSQKGSTHRKAEGLRFLREEASRARSPGSHPLSPRLKERSLFLASGANHCRDASDMEARTPRAGPATPIASIAAALLGACGNVGSG